MNRDSRDKKQFCAKVRPLLDEFWLNKLDAAESERVRAHLQDCKTCREISMLKRSVELRPPREALRGFIAAHQGRIGIRVNALKSYARQGDPWVQDAYAQAQHILRESRSFYHRVAPKNVMIEPTLGGQAPIKVALLDEFWQPVGESDAFTIQQQPTLTKDGKFVLTMQTQDKQYEGWRLLCTVKAIEGRLVTFEGTVMQVRSKHQRLFRGFSVCSAIPIAEPLVAASLEIHEEQILKKAKKARSLLREFHMEIEDEFAEQEKQGEEQEDSWKRKEQGLLDTFSEDQRQRFEQTLERTLRQGIIPDDHPVWKKYGLPWLKAMGEGENWNRRARGLPPVMDDGEAAEKGIQKIKELYRKGQLSTASEILKKAQSLLRGFLNPSKEELKQVALEEFKEAENLLHQARQLGQPLSQKMQDHVERCYNDGFKNLWLYLLIIGLDHIRHVRLPLDSNDVVDTVNMTLEIVYKHSEVIGRADRIVKLAESILLNRLLKGPSLLWEVRVEEPILEPSGEDVVIPQDMVQLYLAPPTTEMAHPTIEVADSKKKPINRDQILPYAAADTQKIPHPDELHPNELLVPVVDQSGDGEEREVGEMMVTIERGPDLTADGHLQFRIKIGEELLYREKQILLEVGVKGKVLRQQSLFYGTSQLVKVEIPDDVRLQLPMVKVPETAEESLFTLPLEVLNLRVVINKGGSSSYIRHAANAAPIEVPSLLIVIKKRGSNSHVGHIFTASGVAAFPRFPSGKPLPERIPADCCSTAGGLLVLAGKSTVSRFGAGTLAQSWIRCMRRGLSSLAAAISQGRVTRSVLSMVGGFVAGIGLR